jgi:RHS repeat-associated protein
LSASVSLSYHSSGIKVNELSSWVGLGFTLNAGGAITRSMHGIADEGRSSNQPRSVPKGWYGSGIVNQISSSVGTHYTGLMTVGCNNSPFIPSGADSYEQALDGRKDTEPDVFNFNIGGYSGKFHLNPDSSQTIKAFTTPAQDIKIEPFFVNNSFDYWVITTPNGTRYYFGEPNVDEQQDKAIDLTLSRPVTEISSNFYEPITSAWYLTKIESADRLNAIIFVYGNKELYQYRNLRSESLQITDYGGCLAGEGDVLYDYNNTKTAIDISAARLCQINTGNERIKITANSLREDIDLRGSTRLFSSIAEDGAHRVDDIQLTDGTGACLKKFTFDYSYFQSSNAFGSQTSAGTDVKRLRLDKLNEQNCLATTSLSHTFNYYGTYPLNGTVNTDLPRRNTFMVDHWGYNNGKSANTSLIPTLTYTDFYGNSTTCQYADRSPDFLATQAGTLSKITYPTGGSTEFVYEANTYNTNKTVRSEQQLFYQVSPIATAGGLSTVQSFTTPASMTGVKYRLKYIPSQGAPSLGSGRVYRNGGLPWLDVTNQIDQPLASAPSTTYTFQVEGIQGFTTFEIYKETFNVVNVNEVVGGLRIKQVMSKTNDNADVITKEYAYGKEGDDLKSSGVYFGLPNYLLVNNSPAKKFRSCNTVTTTNQNTFEQTTTTFCVSDPIRYFASGDAMPKLNLEGSPIGYQRVIVKETNNGYSETLFNYITPAGFNNIYPQVTYIFQDPLNGTVYKQRIFDKDNISKRETTYQYQLKNTKALAGQVVVKNFEKCYGGSVDYIKNDYYINISTFTTTSKEEKIDNVSTLTQYTYRTDLAHLNVILESSVASNGRTTKTKVYYAQDIPSTHPNSAQKQVFIGKYMIGIPLQVENTLGDDNKKTGGLVEYFNFNTSPNNQQWYPIKYFSLNRDSTLKLQFTVNEYYPAGDANNQGLVKKATKAGFINAPEYYFWTKKLLTQKQMGLTGDNATLTSLISYIPNTSLPLMITDENGLRTKFTYDGFQRLSKSENRFSGTLASPTDIQATTYYKYHYKGQPADAAIDVNQNFVQTISTYKGITDPLSTKQYLDGLSRPIEVVKENYTPKVDPHPTVAWHQKNYVSYDALGRQNKSYLPFEDANLGFQLPVAYTGSFLLTEFENSPLSRPIKQTNVDNSVVTTSYGSNTTNEVRSMVAASGNGASVSGASFYAANLLYKTVLTDENLHQTSVFKDKLGRVILTRKLLGTDKVDTYNVYDDYGQLVAVLPPGSVDANGNVTNSLTFQYKYDNQGRLSEKKIPGADPQKFYYDNRDLVTLTQDGNMRNANYSNNTAQHLGTQYDDLGRVLRTGFVFPTDPTTFAASGFTIPEGANKLTENIYYPNRSWIKHHGAKLMETFGPDNTNFIWSYIERRPGLEYTGNPVWTAKQHVVTTNNVLVNRPILDADTYGVDWSVSGYNGMQQPDITYRYMFATYNTGHQSRQVTGFTYDHGRRLTDVKHTYAMDGANVGTPTFTMSNMVYNYKDQLTEKNIGYNPTTNTALQSIDYSYNLRGWLTGINNVPLNPNTAGAQMNILTPTSTGAGTIQNLAVSPFIKSAFMQSPPLGVGGLAPVTDNNPDLYSQAISYDVVDGRYGTAAQKNGNISATTWQVAGRAKQGYGFKYDDLDRLTEANYVDITEGGGGIIAPFANFSTDNKFQEKQTYDLRGNILSLQRNGLNGGAWTSSGLTAATYGLIDNLSYLYNDENKLVRVKDASLLDRGFKSKNNIDGWQYQYDANANLRSDVNKEITYIWYNHLNLPSAIFLTNNRVIIFTYTADGEKVRKVAVKTDGTGEWTHYVNGIVYKGDFIDRMATPEGNIIRTTGSNYEYEYTLKDHLGNTRVTFKDKDNDGVIDTSDIKQINHYYPFGLNMEGNWNGSFAEAKNKYQYNGKELNTDFGLDWMDYGARWYQADAPHWLSIDPLAEKHPNYSPYVYTLNNPIKYIDPNGMDNVLYILTLAGVDATLVNQAIEKANGYFRQMNLNTLVTRANVDFDISKVGSTDGMVLVGQTINQTTDFAPKLVSETNNVLKEMKGWADSDKNPEITDRGSIYLNRGGELSLVAADGIKEYAKENTLTNVDALALVFIHSAGHQALYRHSDFLVDSQKDGFMADGNTLRYMLTGKKSELEHLNGLQMAKLPYTIKSVDDLVKHTNPSIIELIRLRYQPNNQSPNATANPSKRDETKH